MKPFANTRHSLIIIILFLIGFLATPVYAQKVDVYSRPFRSERSHDYDVIHYQVQLRLDDAQKAFYGQNTITIVPLRDEFDECLLDAETFTVTAVQDPSEKFLRYHQKDHGLVVQFPGMYSYGDTVTFSVFYQCEDKAPDGAQFGMSSNYALGLTFGEETEDHPAVIQAISWPEGARHWYPCYDHPNDKATQEMIITVRDDYPVLSNGELVSVKKDTERSQHTYHWSLTHPHPTYLSMIAAGPYVVLRDSLGSLPINYWVYEKDVDKAMRSFHKTPAMIEYFNEEFGVPYPWEKYDQITVPVVGGGQEATTATILGERTIHDQRAEQDYPSHSLVAHEAAHQWWGDFVTLRDWGHTWINESFGTYYDYRWSLHDLGDDEGAVNLLNKKNSYLNEYRTRYMRPIVFHQWNAPRDNFDRHTYPKGACVIHMMRWILGDTPFLKTVTHFLKKHAFQPADTHDFLTAIKEATGKNMDWFFQQWLLSPGHPVFHVQYQWNENDKKIRMKIKQDQDTGKGIPIFKTPVDIGIVTSNGKKREKVWIKEKESTFEFECQTKPILVRFDEGNYLLKEWTFEKSIDELLYQLDHDDVIGRMWAAAELARYADNVKVKNALIRAIKNADFWAVRRSAVLALGGDKDNVPIPFLKEIAIDTSSKVRRATLEVLGETGEKELLLFFVDRFRADDSYVVQAEALRGIGKCGDQSHIPFLQDAKKMNSPRNVIGRAANEAIALLEE